MARWPITAGNALIVPGPLRPLWAKPGCSRRRGNGVLERDTLRVFVPLATWVIAGIVASLILWLINRWGSGGRAGVFCPASA